MRQCVILSGAMQCGIIVLLERVHGLWVFIEVGGGGDGGGGHSQRMLCV